MTAGGGLPIGPAADTTDSCPSLPGSAARLWLRPMLFPTAGFLLFFLVVAAAMMLLETRFAAKKAVLVLASYYFYAQWDWRFCFLLAFSSALSYSAGRLIGATADRDRHRLVVVVAIALHLGLLGVFKYFGFFVLSANALARLLGLQHALPLFQLPLPVGSSPLTC